MVSSTLGFLLLASIAFAAENPAAQDAYIALKTKDYTRATKSFQQAIQAEPSRMELRRELAYTLLKMGETESARDVFDEIVRAAPKDWHSALEYGYLCNETRRVVEARRIFDRIRKLGDTESKVAAERAYQNVDKPLADAMQRSFQSLTQNPGDYSAAIELARAAEQRDDAKAAAEFYQRAWTLRPSDRQLLVDLGKARKSLGDQEGANGAWLAAARGSQARAAEQARELMPSRYPYATEFRKALELDRANVALRRELAFLYLAVNRQAEAEAEFLRLLEQSPDDLISLAQVGLLRLARNDRAGALPFLDKVLKGKDTVLAAKVQEALKKAGTAPAPPTPPLPGPPPPRAAVERNSKQMGDKSYQSGFLADAARYYQAAREENPKDSDTHLKLGRTYNMLRQDDEAIRYFDMARRSKDRTIRREAQAAYRNLKPSTARFRTTTWMFPMFSSRWHEGFSYGQWKTDMRLGKLPFRPYVSTRLVADSQRGGGSLQPQYLSESSFIFGLGVATAQWKGLSGWAEAGSAVRYRERKDVGRMIPDYRAGLAWSKTIGHGLRGDSAGWFAETNDDAVTLSRFQWNLLVVSQNRAGFTLPRIGELQWQAVWNANLTVDRMRETWANFVDLGPGVRWRLRRMPQSMVWSLDFLRGRYLIAEGNPRGPVYYDIRAGLWYAITR